MCQTPFMLTPALAHKNKKGNKEHEHLRITKPNLPPVYGLIDEIINHGFLYTEE